MLPKISAALVQLIPAVTSSSNRRTHVNDHEREKQNSKFERFQAPPSKNEKPELKPVTSEKNVTPMPALASTSSVAHAFIQLLYLFQKRRSVLVKWFGIRAYQSASKEQRKLGKTRKGSVLDDKAA